MSSTGLCITHFLLILIMRFLFYAFYHIEENQIVLRKGEEQIDTIRPARRIEKLPKYSPRLGCVCSLLDRMSENDWLDIVSLSDLGETAEEAEHAYHWILDKGIRLSFFDASYLNPDILVIGSNPSEYQKLLIHNLITNYYLLKDKGQVIPKEKISRLTALESAKKSDPKCHK